MIYRLEKENEIIVIQNKKIKREIFFRNGTPVRSRVTRTESGYAWDTGECDAILSLPGFDFATAKTSYDDETKTVTFEGAYTVYWKFEVSPLLPAVRSQLSVSIASPVPDTGNCPISETVGHGGRHLSLKAVNFYDQSDRIDCFVKEEQRYLFTSPANLDGRLFFAGDPTNGESCILWKEAPLGVSELSPAGCDLRATVRLLQICGAGIDFSVAADGISAGYPVVTLLCGKGEEEELCRAWYAENVGGLGSYIMSNTWGDRAQDANVNEEFLKREILAAKELGLDVMQIDAGWANGTPDSEDSDGEGGSYGANPACWEPNPERFPAGLPALCDFAREQGIAVGLWFSPDGYRDYTNWEKDADAILRLYRTCGIRYFKLDGIDLANKASETNFLRMCRKIRKESNGDVDFQLDITNNRRTGYFFDKQFGSLFVENRYTDWTNYFPHNTYRNLWQLSRYIPAQKLQFEVLNPRRNVQNYGNDPLAPANYDIDYLFATVMVSSPLIWMEMQFLGEEDKKRLSSLIETYRQYRDDFRDVRPIGECPDGYSVSGFLIRGEKHNYAVLIRELSENNRFTLPVSRILATNDENVKFDGTDVVFSEKRKYVFALLD